jgi:hypothetical protein
MGHGRKENDVMLIFTSKLSLDKREDGSWKKRK